MLIVTAMLLQSSRFERGKTKRLLLKPRYIRCAVQRQVRGFYIGLSYSRTDIDITISFSREIGRYRIVIESLATGFQISSCGLRMIRQVVQIVEIQGAGQAEGSLIVVGPAMPRNIEAALFQIPKEGGVVVSIERLQTIVPAIRIQNDI